MLTVTKAQPLHPSFRLPQPLSLQIARGEQWVLTGRMGSGKTTIGRILTRALPLREGSLSCAVPRSEVRMVAFHDTWGDTLPSAHQLRWHHGEAVTSPLVSDFLGEAIYNKECFAEIGHLLSKPLHWLSSGELRKVHLVKALSNNVCFAVIDEPFIGLDSEARADLAAFLARRAQTTTFVLLLSDVRDIPAFITHHATVENLSVTQILPHHAAHAAAHSQDAKPDTLQPLCEKAPSEEVVRLNDVSVTYFGKPILQNVSWTVHRGERWLLTGQNGAGKSTLLSLICADNPMAYAQDVRVFGYRRGHSGTIWDVKRRIGYVSPEMVRGIVASQSVTGVVAAGLQTTGRLYRQPTDTERDTASDILHRLSASHLADRDFLTLSDGERRLVLLARALVKRPELLILDEPFQGVDTLTRDVATQVIKDTLGHTGTLIFVSHYPQEAARLVHRELHLTPPHLPKAF